MPANLRLHGAPAVVALIVTLGVVALAAAGGHAVAAKQPKCGETITADTTLHKDLVDCPNNGIVIGADHITLDLNGHTIDGDATPAAGCDPRKGFCDVGVANEGHDGVTVIHGSVRQFVFGVWALRASHNRLLGVSSTGNSLNGIVVFRLTRSLVRNSSGNGSAAHNTGAGMLLLASNHVQILHSSFRHNGDMGIALEDSTDNLIRGNLLAHNKNFGVVLRGGTVNHPTSVRNQVRGNRSVRDGVFGIYIAPGSRNMIAGNRISHVRSGEEGTGIEVDGGDHNVFARNSVRDTKGNAIEVGFDPAVGTVVRGNRIWGAGEDGVHVNPKATHTLLWRNRVSHSRDDGIVVKGRRSKVTRNRAVRNGDLGIEAVHGVIDGGGNKASGNGDRRQCIHIVCN